MTFEKEMILNIHKCKGFRQHCSVYNKRRCLFFIILFIRAIDYSSQNTFFTSWNSNFENIKGLTLKRRKWGILEVANPWNFTAENTGLHKISFFFFAVLRGTGISKAEAHRNSVLIVVWSTDKQL